MTNSTQDIKNKIADLYAQASEALSSMDEKDRDKLGYALTSVLTLGYTIRFLSKMQRAAKAGDFTQATYYATRLAVLGASTRASRDEALRKGIIK